MLGVAIVVPPLWVLFNAERHSAGGFCAAAAVRWAKAARRLACVTVFASSARMCIRRSHLRHGKISRSILNDWIQLGESGRVSRRRRVAHVRMNRHVTSLTNGPNYTRAQSNENIYVFQPRVIRNGRLYYLGWRLESRAAIIRCDCESIALASWTKYGLF